MTLDDGLTGNTPGNPVGYRCQCGFVGETGRSLSLHKKDCPIARLQRVNMNGQQVRAPATLGSSDLSHEENHIIDENAILVKENQELKMLVESIRAENIAIKIECNSFRARSNTVTKAFAELWNLFKIVAKDPGSFDSALDEADISIIDQGAKLCE